MGNSAGMNVGRCAAAALIAPWSVMVVRIPR